MSLYSLEGKSQNISKVKFQNNQKKKMNESFKLERIAFFIAVAYAAFIAIPNYFVLDNSILFFAVRVLVAVAVGLLAIKFRALIYTLIASFLGATLMKRAIFILFPSLSPGIVTAINIGVIVLVVIGILSQIQEYGRAS